MNYEEKFQKLDTAFDNLCKDFGKIFSDEIGNETEAVIFALYKNYADYPTPKDYMLRMVDRLEKPEDHEAWSGDTLRLRILKQFIKYGNYLTDAGYGSENAIKSYARKQSNDELSNVLVFDMKKEDVLRYVDDGIFEKLKTASGDSKKYSKTYGLLRTADDLAEGRFRADAVRRDLYMFAMVYGMTYCADEDGKDPDTDIEINLFQGYYTNNLMRYMSEDFRKNRKKAYEEDPSEQGINYKNYAEVIYLYCISQNLEPSEKIRWSSVMINGVIKFGFEYNFIFFTPLIDETYYYRKLIEDELFHLEKYEFLVFICKHYVLSGKKNEGVLQIKKNQDAAFHEYMWMMEKFDGSRNSEDTCVCHGGGWSWVSNDEYTGMFSVDVSYYKEKEKMETLCARARDRIKSFDEENFREFFEILRGVDELLQWKKPRTELTITRSSLIVTYYFYYVMCGIVEEREYDNICWNLKKEFIRFKYGVDVSLERAGYQPLSEKNLFDVLVVCSAFAHFR